MRVKFNPLLTLGKQLIGSNFTSDFHCKYADYNLVYAKANSDLKYLLDNVDIQGNHRYVCVDIKLQKLVKDEPTCIVGWHIDTVENPLNSKELPEVHHLLVTSELARTEFIENEIELDVTEHMTLKDIRFALIQHNINVFRIPTNTFVTFGRYNFHRGPFALDDGERLLVRVTETNIVKPNNTLKYGHYQLFGK